MSQRPIHNEKQCLKRAYRGHQNFNISDTVKSLLQTLILDAKRSDFVRNRDMEGDIEVYGQDAPKTNIMLKFQMNNYDLKSIIMNHLPLKYFIQ